MSYVYPSHRAYLIDLHSRFAVLFVVMAVFAVLAVHPWILGLHVSTFGLFAIFFCISYLIQPAWRRQFMDSFLLMFPLLGLCLYWLNLVPFSVSQTGLTLPLIAFGAHLAFFWYPEQV